MATFDAPQWTGPVHVESAVRAFVPPPPLTGSPYVSDLPFVTESNGWGPVERDRSVNESGGGDGNPLTIAGVKYEKGLGTHAPAEVTGYLNGRCTSFSAALGLDDEITQPGPAAFRITGDGEQLYDSGVLRPGSAVPVAVDVTGGPDARPRGHRRRRQQELRPRRPGRRQTDLSIVSGNWFAQFASRL